MGDDPHSRRDAAGVTFRRAVPAGMAAHRQRIEAQRAALDEARTGGDPMALIEAAGSLGFSLFLAGEEAHAEPLLEEALALSRKIGDRATEIDGLLGLGTARQYLGRREEAVSLFDEGLRLCEETGLDAQEHFLLHHLGRCLVEMGRVDEARAAFQAALVIRKRLGDKRFIDSSQGALDEIAAL